MIFFRVSVVYVKTILCLYLHSLVKVAIAHVVRGHTLLGHGNLWGVYYKSKFYTSESRSTLETIFGKFKLNKEYQFCLTLNDNY